ncbi:hypothetical protein CTA1_6063 [Colletotrichum tanaceti]|uniref:Uncharacterized protein n=1 Tax=Colletotrichum tanaceti TaxID=1306861 RepID=A0A4U6X0S3_9PEZI|nr:hypothetical protein CTA1_6063 [Colletotrichum tanaceti]
MALVARFDSVEALQKATRIPHLCFFHDPAARLRTEEKREREGEGRLNLNQAMPGNANHAASNCVESAEQGREGGLPNTYMSRESGGDVGIRNEGVSWRWATLGLTNLFLEAHDH